VVPLFIGRRAPPLRITPGSSPDADHQRTLGTAQHRLGIAHHDGEFIRFGLRRVQCLELMHAREANERASLELADATRIEP
jgi:hypothetical protein